MCCHLQRRFCLSLDSQHDGPVCSAVLYSKPGILLETPLEHLLRGVGAILQATPANWPNNHESIGKKGWAFLLPTVTVEDAKKHFPDYHSCKVPSGIDYLRLTDVGSLM